MWRYCLPQWLTRSLFHKFPCVAASCSFANPRVLKVRLCGTSTLQTRLRVTINCCYSVSYHASAELWRCFCVLNQEIISIISHVSWPKNTCTRSHLPELCCWLVGHKTAVRRWSLSAYSRSHFYVGEKGAFCVLWLIGWWFANAGPLRYALGSEWQVLCYEDEPPRNLSGVFTS